MKVVTFVCDYCGEVIDRSDPGEVTVDACSEVDRYHICRGCRDGQAEAITAARVLRAAGKLVVLELVGV